MYKKKPAIIDDLKWSVTDVTETVEVYIRLVHCQAAERNLFEHLFYHFLNIFIWMFI